MMGIDGGGLRKRPPRAMPVPWEGGASPMTCVVPTVTSASGLPSRPTPTTPPVAPCPAETDTATRGGLPGWPCGPGGDDPPDPPPPLVEPDPDGDPPAEPGASPAPGPLA